MLEAAMCPNHICHVTSRVTRPASQSRIRLIWNYFVASQSQVATWSDQVRVESQERSSRFVTARSSTCELRKSGILSSCFRTVVNMRGAKIGYFKQLFSTALVIHTCGGFCLVT